MKFVMEGLTVYFPYEYIYPEQVRWQGHGSHRSLCCQRY